MAEDLSLTVTLQFKSQREKDEFLKVSPRVQALTLLTAFKMRQNYKYQAVVTSIFRTPEEQEGLIKAGNPAVARSPHSQWRAVDIRLKDFDQKEKLAEIESFLNSEFPRSDGFKTGLVHGVGEGLHLHLQVPANKKF